MLHRQVGSGDDEAWLSGQLLIASLVAEGHTAAHWLIQEADSTLVRNPILFVDCGDSQRRYSSCTSRGPIRRTTQVNVFLWAISGRDYAAPSWPSFVQRSVESSPF
ncbi:hypothetical protein VTK26DRAFT_6564 [Humicola hyalothermophila]